MMAKAQKDVAEKVRAQIKTPKRYVVYLLNDDYTTMEFVVKVLMLYFGHNARAAFDIMMKVHEEGRGVCGAYPFEIAETKIAQVHTHAKANNFPLRAFMEEE
ncbi:MAG: ATP-dependent Clp protease adapter ClpS [Campylobacteraceae bacterium]|jgi:ATP-dependent Clp protease adaptor protein ClpS|nr:ATP-dependent Clp protease adapter ClpS [Campylobacteraceae bacterium]